MDNTAYDTFRVSISKLIGMINPQKATIYYTDPKSLVRIVLSDIKINFREDHLRVIFVRYPESSRSISFNKDSDFKEIYDRFEVLVPDYDTCTFVPIIIEELVSSQEEFDSINCGMSKAFTREERQKSFDSFVKNIKG